jgi:uncharacterized protein (DUF58 family)
MSVMVDKNKNGKGLIWISTEELLALQAQAKTLNLAKGQIRARQTGQHLSAFKGRGMDFAESRLYQPGDDIRSMDWRVTARTGKPHTKVFEEERERPVLLWVDMRDTMFFATRGMFKSVVAAELAALLAWKTRLESDRIGGMIALSDSHIEIKPSHTRSGVVRFLQKIAIATQKVLVSRDQASKEESTAEHLRRLRRVVATGSRVYLLSDFRGLNKEAQRQLIAISKKAEIRLISISDPFEHEIGLKDGALVVQAQQSEDQITLNLKAGKWRHEYQKVATSRLSSLKSFVRKYQLQMVTVSTSDTYKRRLQKLATW